MSEAGRINRFRKYQWRLAHKKKLPKQISKQDFAEMEKEFAPKAMKQAKTEVKGDPVAKAEAKTGAKK